MKPKELRIGNWVMDHNSWYYYAKEAGITHWFNDRNL